MSQNKTYASFVLLVFLGIIATLVFVPPIPQWQSYHHFADVRTLWSIPNFANVISNLPFCLVGLMGFFSLRYSIKANYLNYQEIIVFFILFTGVFLTGFGSAYYHWFPDNNSLVWDRLPMTIVFMALLSLTFMERINLKLGFALLIPLLAFGIGSVWYWHYTELLGRGDLRFYGLTQFYSMILIIGILYFFRKPYPSAKAYGWMFVFYVIAKLFEHFDGAIYSLGGAISGHTLKHIFAAISAYWIVVVLNEKARAA